MNGNSWAPLRLRSMLPKTRRNDEHVDRDNVGHVVLQKGAPGRGGDFGAPRHVSSDRGLADFDTKLEQFAVDSGRAPKRVDHTHLADQVTGLGAPPGPAHHRLRWSPPPAEP